MRSPLHWILGAIDLAAVSQVKFPKWLTFISNLIPQCSSVNLAADNFNHHLFCSIRAAKLLFLFDSLHNSNLKQKSRRVVCELIFCIAKACKQTWAIGVPILWHFIYSLRLGNEVLHQRRSDLIVDQADNLAKILWHMWRQTLGPQRSATCDSKMRQADVVVKPRASGGLLRQRRCTSGFTCVCWLYLHQSTPPRLDTSIPRHSKPSEPLGHKSWDCIQWWYVHVMDFSVTRGHPHIMLVAGGGFGKCWYLLTKWEGEGGWWA